MSGARHMSEPSLKIAVEEANNLKKRCSYLQQENEVLHARMRNDDARIVSLEAALRRLVYAAEHCPHDAWLETARADIQTAKVLLGDKDIHHENRV